MAELLCLGVWRGRAEDKGGRRGRSTSEGRRAARERTRPEPSRLLPRPAARLAHAPTSTPTLIRQHSRKSRIARHELHARSAPFGALVVLTLRLVPGPGRPAAARPAVSAAAAAAGPLPLALPARDIGRHHAPPWPARSDGALSCDQMALRRPTSREPDGRRKGGQLTHRPLSLPSRSSTRSTARPSHSSRSRSAARRRMVRVGLS
jgi:hypothetical protein